MLLLYYVVLESLLGRQLILGHCATLTTIHLLNSFIISLDIPYSYWETLYPFNNNLPFSLAPAPGIHCSKTPFLSCDNWKRGRGVGYPGPCGVGCEEGRMWETDSQEKEESQPCLNLRKSGKIVTSLENQSNLIYLSSIRKVSNWRWDYKRHLLVSARLAKFIYLFSKYWRRTHYVPGTGRTTLPKTCSSSLWSLPARKEEDSKQKSPKLC